MFGSNDKRSARHPAGPDRHHRRSRGRASRTAGRASRTARLRRIEWPVATLSALVAALLAVRAALSIAAAVIGLFLASLPRRTVAAARRVPAALAAVRHPNRRATFAALTSAAVALTTAAGVAGIGAGVDSAATQHVAATSSIDLNDRLVAAQRADRSARTATPAAPTPAAPTPAVPTPAVPTPAKKKPARPPAWVAPMAKFELSSCFGPRWGLMHQGLDFAMPAGTVIRAAGAGTVLAAGWTFAGYGISVVIDHGNGYLTHYAHASKVWVRPGQKVKPGQAIAREGSTGDSTGPHLHFEVHKGAMWHQIDPAKFLRARGVKIGC